MESSVSAVDCFSNESPCVMHAMCAVVTPMSQMDHPTLMLSCTCTVCMLAVKKEIYL